MNATKQTRPFNVMAIACAATVAGALTPRSASSGNSTMALVLCSTFARTLAPTPLRVTLSRDEPSRITRTLQIAPHPVLPTGRRQDA